MLSTILNSEGGNTVITKQTNVMDSWVKNFRQATEANLRIQQDLLRGWTRYWPGFTGRPVSVEAKEGEARFRSPWSEGFIRMIEAQRDLVMQQYDASLAVLESMIDGTEGVVADILPKEVAAKAVALKEPIKEPINKEFKEMKDVKEAPAPKAVEKPIVEEVPSYFTGNTDNIRNKVAVITGAASGIGAAVAQELANRGAKAVMLIDRSEDVKNLAKQINDSAGKDIAHGMVGDTTDEAFRKRVFNDATEKYGLVTICVPAAGITRDALSVVVDKETGKANLYPTETFRQVAEVNLIAPIYWGMEMVARIAEDRRQRGLKRWEPEEKIQGVVVFLGSVSSQGNKGQISYATTKAGLEGAAATLTKEAIFHGVRCGIIHPGFTDTPMARALGEDFLNKYVLPFTQLRRLIKPEEIADAICFMINNSAVSGELWADAGWHGPA
jgi:3-oxoacyl-[acyl-carrier protein] reductase